MKLPRIFLRCLAPLTLLALLLLARALVGQATAERPASCHYAQEVAAPNSLRPYVKLACFNRDNLVKGGGVRLHLTQRGAALATLPWSPVAAGLAEFVVGNDAWLGDRPVGSVAAEIRWHARFGKFQPIQIQSRCRDLDWFEPFWQCEPAKNAAGADQ